MKKKTVETTNTTMIRYVLIFYALSTQVVKKSFHSLVIQSIQQLYSVA